MLPAYPIALAGVENARDVSRSTDEGKILLGRVPDSRLPIYLFDQPDLFRRPGGLARFRSPQAPKKLVKPTAGPP